MPQNRLLMLFIPALALFTTGCTHYYAVQDPGGSKTYYTTSIDKTKAGAIRLIDEKSGSVVTLQSSEVKEISEEEFNAAVKGQEGKK